MKNILIKCLVLSVCLLTGKAYAQTMGTWQELGPFGKTQSTTDASRFLGIGLISTVAVHPTKPDTIFLGAVGGMWVSYNQGNNWQSFINNKELEHTTAVGSIEIDAINPDYIYIGSGVKSVSRQKQTHVPDQTTDGVYRCQMVGNAKVITKMSTGLPDPLGYYPDQYSKFSSTNGLKEPGYYIHTLKLNPFNSNILYAGTSVGLYYTLNARDANPTWQKVIGVPTEAVRSIVFTSGSTASNYSMYVTGDYFAVNTQDFVSWNNLLGVCSECLNVNDSYYLTQLGGATAVSRSTFYASASLKYPNKVYIGMTLVSNNLYYHENGDELVEPAPYTFKRYFMSHEGSTWTRLAKARSSGFDPLLSAAYNSALSPYERILMGSEYLETLVEGGAGVYSLFENRNGYYTGGYPSNPNPNYWYLPSPYSHGDIQAMCFGIDNQTLYMANDGMISKFNPFASNLIDIACWLPIQNNNLSALVGYFMDVHPSSSDYLAAAAMHNHISVKKPGESWKTSLSVGDGLEVCFSQGNELLCMTQNSGSNLTIMNLTSYSESTQSGYVASAWYYKNIYRDPKEDDVFYNIGGGKVSRSIRTVVNNVVSFSSPQLLTDLTTFDWNDPSAVAISPSDNNYIYLALSPIWYYPDNAKAKLYYTTNAKQASPVWNSITAPSEYVATQNWIKGLAVSSLDPKTVFLAYYDKVTDGRPRVYRSTNAGGVWQDYNNSAGSIPGRYRIHCLLYEKGSNDGVYAGTDNGVYYTNRNMTNWIRYDLGMPNAPAVDLHYHIKDNKILALLWGRGVWRADPYCLASGSLTINATNGSSYSNKPAEANGNITFSASTDLYSPSPRFELRSTSSIDLAPGAYFISNGLSYTLDAYITPCSGSSSLREGVVEENPNAVFVPTTSNTMEEEVTSMKIYPNPIQSGEKTKLFVGDYVGAEIEIKVVDMTGKVCFEVESESIEHELELDLGQLVSGTYILHVTVGTKTVYTSKLVVPGMNQGPDLTTQDTFQRKKLIKRKK